MKIQWSNMGGFGPAAWRQDSTHLEVNFHHRPAPSKRREAKSVDPQAKPERRV